MLYDSSRCRSDRQGCIVACLVRRTERMNQQQQPLHPSLPKQVIIPPVADPGWGGMMQPRLTANATRVRNVAFDRDIFSRTYLTSSYIYILNAWKLTLDATVMPAELVLAVAAAAGGCIE